MEIISFKKHNNFVDFKMNDENIRKNGIACFNNVNFIGRNLFYPNILLKSVSEEKLISPYDETIMSLNKSSFYDNNIYELEINNLNCNETKIIACPVFFFVYNFDNYYHYLYDTIPYLYFYFYLKKIYPEIKLVINYPNPLKNNFYEFNIGILNKFIDCNNDLIIHKTENLYEKLYVSTSLTHGGFSNLPPNNEIYDLYSMMKQNITTNPKFNKHKYIYISRRTWINNDISNIGTNYTTRRKMMNEDILVEELKKLGVVEIFAENLTIDEKICLFNNAELIIGSIGGGMSNLLFSKTKTKSIIIVTPEFLEINTRFKYSMEHTEITYFNNVETYKTDNKIPMFCRVKINTGFYKNKIGEIIDYDYITNKYNINISNNDVAGFNSEIIFNNEWVLSDDFDLLDKGLNSPYVVNINDLISLIKSKINYDISYKIINKTKDIEYNIKIEEIFSLIKKNPLDEYIKSIDDLIVPINNKIVLNTKFICHRINTIEELSKIPSIFGIELDIRDDNLSKKIHLEHDPFIKGIYFDEYLKYYNHNNIILNIKSERTELKCIELMDKFNINDYFFLDSGLPMIYLLNEKNNNSNIACRFSEFEPIELYFKIKNLIKWIWVDCFTQIPISIENYSIFKKDNKKICLVSPELQNQKSKINDYRNHIIENELIPDAICCKFNNIINWI